MYIDKHYPFSMVPLKYSLTSFEDFLDYQTLSIHYNQIYKEYLEKLNNLLKDEATLQTLSLDEILFNESILPKEKKEGIINNASGVYNHQIIFSSITPNPVVTPSTKLKTAIEKKYHTMHEFYQKFKEACLSIGNCGFVFLVCDKDGNLSIAKIKGNKTTVPSNLCPILGIDMFEHAYYLKYKHDIKKYVDTFMKYICYDYVNSEYDECLKAIEELKGKNKEN